MSDAERSDVSGIDVGLVGFYGLAGTLIIVEVIVAMMAHYHYAAGVEVERKLVLAGPDLLADEREKQKLSLESYRQLSDTTFALPVDRAINLYVAKQKAQ